MVKLKESMNAPTFNIPRDNNLIINTKDIHSPYIVYFYPKDDTPGCTKEAIEFTENIDFFKKYKITIIGVSKDTVEKHDKFIAKHHLNIILGSDINGEVCSKYGVWVEKSMYGRKYMGIERSTFLISANGKIYKIWNKVKVKGHVDDVITNVKLMLNKID